MFGRKKNLALTQQNVLLREKISDLEEQLKKASASSGQTDENHFISESHLRNVIQSMPVMLDAFDKDYNILVWNKECERVTGYTEAELKGHPMPLEKLYPDKEYLRKIIERLEAIPGEYRNERTTLVAKDGTRKTIAWSNISRENPIPGWSTWAIGVDVTEQVESEERLKLSLESAGEGMWQWDLKKKEVHLDDGARKMLGYEPEDELGQDEDSILSILHNSDREPTLDKAYDYLEGRRDSYDCEFRMRKKDGSFIWIWSVGKISQRDMEGNPWIFTGIHRDISRQKKNDKELEDYRNRLEQLIQERTQELEEKNRVLERINRAMVDREFRVKELRDELEKYKNQYPEL